MSILQAIRAFWSFDHPACYQRMHSSHIVLQYVLGSRRWTRPDFQLFENGFFALLVDLVALIIIAAIVRLWSLPAAVVAARYARVSPRAQSFANPRTAYLLAFVFVLLGIGSTWTWAAGVVEYVHTCRSLLGVQ